MPAVPTHAHGADGPALPSAADLGGRCGSHCCSRGRLSPPPIPSPPLPGALNGIPAAGRGLPGRIPPLPALPPALYPLSPPPSPLRARHALSTPQRQRSAASPAAEGSVHLSPQRRSGHCAPEVGRRKTPARLCPSPHRLRAQSSASAPAAPPLRTRRAAGAAFYTSGRR